MSYTNLLIHFCLVAAVALLAACGSTPKMADVDEGAVDEQATVDGADPAAQGPQFLFDLIGPDQNPYLAQQVSVPGAASALFADAIRAIQTEQWTRAENLLQQLIGQYPKLSGPHLNLGIVYRQRNQFDKAEEAFAKAVTVNAMNLDAFNQLALLKREQGDFKAAELHYLSALSVWPKHDVSHKNIGILYDLYLGEFDKALEHFEIYQFLQPEPDRRMGGWIIDLKRRIAKLQAAGAQP